MKMIAHRTMARPKSWLRALLLGALLLPTLAAAQGAPPPAPVYVPAPAPVYVPPPMVVVPPPPPSRAERKAYKQEWKAERKADKEARKAQRRAYKDGVYYAPQ